MKKVWIAAIAALPVAALAGTATVPPCCQAAAKARAAARPAVHHAPSRKTPKQTVRGRGYVLPAVVRNYYVGPMVDAENPDVRMGSSVVSRVVASPTWNLTPEPSVATVQGHKIASNGQTLEASRLEAVQSQAESDAKVIRALQSEVEAMRAKLTGKPDETAKQDAIQADLRELKEEVRRLKESRAPTASIEPVVGEEQR